MRGPRDHCAPTTPTFHAHPNCVSAASTMNSLIEPLVQKLKAQVPDLRLVMLFGSFSAGCQRDDSGRMGGHKGGLMGELTGP